MDFLWTLLFSAQRQQSNFNFSSFQDRTEIDFGKAHNRWKREREIERTGDNLTRVRIYLRKIITSSPLNNEHRMPPPPHERSISRAMFLLLSADSLTYLCCFRWFIEGCMVVANSTQWFLMEIPEKQPFCRINKISSAVEC